MKKTTIFAAVAASCAFALTVPDWNHTLNAAYANPIYTLSDTVVTQKLTVAGCKPLKKAVKGDVTMYDDGSYVMYRYDWTLPYTALTGTWAKVPGKTSDTFYLSFNSASRGELFDGLNSDALANCKLKYPAMTYVTIMEPSVLIKKNTIVVKVKDTSAKGTMMLSGVQDNNEKGVNATGTVKASWKLTGGVWQNL